VNTVLLSFPRSSARVGGKKVLDLFGESLAPQSVNHHSFPLDRLEFLSTYSPSRRNADVVSIP
jgi:hypothetical protein